MQVQDLVNTVAVQAVKIVILETEVEQLRAENRRLALAAPVNPLDTPDEVPASATPEPEGEHANG